MKLIREQLLLANMEGWIGEVHGAYRPKDKAYEILKRWSGQDFGYDTDAWREWFAKYGEKLSDDALHDAIWAVMPPDPKDLVDDPDEEARLEAEIAELRREWAESHPTPKK